MPLRVGLSKMLASTIVTFIQCTRQAFVSQVKMEQTRNRGRCSLRTDTSSRKPERTAFEKPVCQQEGTPPVLSAVREKRVSHSLKGLLVSLLSVPQNTTECTLGDTAE